MSENEVKRLADLRLRVEERIKELEEELELMREVERLIDDALRRGSFAKASQVAPGEEVPRAEEEEAGAVRALRRTRDGVLLANARIGRETLTVEVNPELNLRSSIPPFKSYFINRVLSEMKAKDEEEGRRPLTYEIEESSDGRLSRIVIRNPGDEDRINELLNILTWTLSKMLEKVERPGAGAGPSSDQ
ncbi:MAG: hypothetical protein RXP91_05260 [Nitrososphaeria archaeon]